ncbi:signal peptidase I [Bacillus sp. JJ722]|uniref:signal peptidase I n=1 Tax=Bacillus sp. JJ722 TaxID=3122973 RepID=UPI002FFFB115
MEKNYKNGWISWIKVFLLALFLVIFSRHFLFLPTTVQGASMSPTLDNQNKVLINKVSSIKRFDTIVFNAPDSNNNYIKRVIGFPGDRIEMKNDILYINDKRFEEDYLSNMKENLVPNETLTEDFLIEIVPDDSLFVLGDNRRVSKDSRIFGFIPMSSVIGKVEFRFYPLKDLGNI